MIIDVHTLHIPYITKGGKSKIKVEKEKTQIQKFLMENEHTWFHSAQRFGLIPRTAAEPERNLRFCGPFYVENSDSFQMRLNFEIQIYFYRFYFVVTRNIGLWEWRSNTIDNPRLFLDEKYPSPVIFEWEMGCPDTPGFSAFELFRFAADNILNHERLLYEKMMVR